MISAENFLRCLIMREAFTRVKQVVYFCKGRLEDFARVDWNTCASVECIHLTCFYQQIANFVQKHASKMDTVASSFFLNNGFVKFHSTHYTVSSLRSSLFSSGKSIMIILNSQREFNEDLRMMFSYFFGSKSDCAALKNNNSFEMIKI